MSSLLLGLFVKDLLSSSQNDSLVHIRTLFDCIYVVIYVLIVN